MVRAVLCPGGHTPEPSTNGAHFKALPESRTQSLPQRVLMAPPASIANEISPLCRPSYNHTTVKNRRGRGTPPGQTLPLREHCTQVVFLSLPLQWQGSGQGREWGSYWPSVNETMNCRWSGPAQQCIQTSLTMHVIAKHVYNRVHQ